MKYAIVEDGGKQYKVMEGDTVDLDHYEAEIGDQVDLDRVLLVSDSGQVVVGTPYIENARVEATVVSHIKGPKVTVFKYKPKIRYRVKKGHRQKYTRVRIDSIHLEAGGKNGA